MPHASTSHALRLLGIAVTLCALTAGCGASAETAAPRETSISASSPSQSPEPTTSVPSKPYTVEELAATVGCTPEFQGKPMDFRQAVCESGGRQFVLLDFATATGQRDWLEYSQMYGGVYLVGERWVLSASSKDYMVELSRTLGGSIEQSGGMSDPSGD